MRRIGAKLAGALTGFVVFYCADTPQAYAQQKTETNFVQTYESALAKAKENCAALWSDHAFDPFRSKFPSIDADESPTNAMLTNTERLSPKDRPLADLAIKTIKKCRAGYAPAYAMLPPRVANMIHGIELEQDVLIAKLYNRKITFGEYNQAIS